MNLDAVYTSPFLKEICEGLVIKPVHRLALLKRLKDERTGVIQKPADVKVSIRLLG